MGDRAEDGTLSLQQGVGVSVRWVIERRGAGVQNLAAIQFSWAAAEALGAACPAREPFDAFFANAHAKTLARVDRVDRVGGGRWMMAFGGVGRSES